jgi:hypothetical protein
MLKRILRTMGVVAESHKREEIGKHGNGGMSARVVRVRILSKKEVRK